MMSRLVDGALMYDCPYSGKSYILVVQNAIHVPSMENNLIPPFMTREGGIVVNESAKIHTNDPIDLDHSITFNSTGFRIPLYLWGIFSYFSTHQPMQEDLMAGHNVYVLSPSRWDPHSEAYGQNEANMTDWEGNVKELKDQLHRVVIDEIEDEIDARKFVVSSTESNTIDNICGDQHSMVDAWQEGRIPRACDDINLHLGRVLSILVDSWLAQQVEIKLDLGHDQIAIGSTIGMDPDEFLYHEADDSDLDEQISQDSVDVVDNIHDLDQFFVSGVEATGTKGVGARHLSKVWQISHEDAQWMLDITSQHGNRLVDPQLSKNYGTNDRMLRYKRIKEYFYMDTFFSTKKGGKSSHDNLCCQLFVTDKGFLYVVPLKQKSKMMLAVKQFTKEIGAPDTIVCDMSMEQTSLEIKAFLNDIGTTLRVLEEGTPWANKAERYIGLLKESVRKDTRELNSPLPFWDYCLEQRVHIYNMTARDYPTVWGTKPHTLVTGEEGDISNLCQFS